MIHDTRLLYSGIFLLFLQKATYAISISMDCPNCGSRTMCSHVLELAIEISDFRMQRKTLRNFKCTIISVLFVLSFLMIPIAQAGVISATPYKSSRHIRNALLDETDSKSSGLAAGLYNSTAKTSHQSSTTLIEPKKGKPDEADLSPNVVTSNPGSNPVGSSSNGKNILQTGSTKEPPFDEKAIQRSFLVLAGLGTILLAYFGIKFACVKKRKTGGTGNSPRYGLVESSEMDLLDSIEEDDEDEEDNTLFDLHSHRRT